MDRVVRFNGGYDNAFDSKLYSSVRSGESVVNLYLCNLFIVHHCLRAWLSHLCQRNLFSILYFGGDCMEKTGLGLGPGRHNLRRQPGNQRASPTPSHHAKHCICQRRNMTQFLALVQRQPIPKRADHVLLTEFYSA